MTDDNAASALYEILNDVRSSKRQQIGEAWADVLDCKVGTSEFAQRHAEVVNLFRRVHSFVNAMPEGTQRDIYLRYAPAWHAGVVPRGNWDSPQNPPAKVISQSNLDQLGGVMQVLSITSADDFTDEAQDALVRGLKEWKDLLDEAGLPPGISEQVRSQVAHIEWLLANVSLFGSEPVVRESRNLIGLGVEVLQLVPVKARKVGAAMAYIVYMLGLVHAGIDHTAGILEGLNEVSAQIEVITDNPPELSAESNEEIVDAEFEEDPPGESDLDTSD